MTMTKRQRFLEKETTRQKVAASTVIRGTEGTGKYGKPILTIQRGVLGVRDLKNGSFCIRVEPIEDSDAVCDIAETLNNETGWKEPGDGGEFRFSRVADNLYELAKFVSDAVDALRVAGGLERRWTEANYLMLRILTRNRSREENIRTFLKAHGTTVESFEAEIAEKLATEEKTGAVGQANGSPKKDFVLPQDRDLGDEIDDLPF